MVMRADNSWHHNPTMHLFVAGIGVALRQGIADSDNHIIFDGDINAFLHFRRV